PDPRRLLVMGSLAEAGSPAASKEVLPLPLVESATRDLPGVERVAIFADAGKLRLEGDHQFEWAPVAETDAAFFQVLSFDLVAGRTLGPRPTTREVVLTDQAARSLFGDGPALGKTVRW